MIKQYLIDLYIDYFNNYLTIDKIAEHNGLDIDDMISLLKLSKKLHEEKVKQRKEAYKNEK